jgi:hypothetical protein
VDLKRLETTKLLDSLPATIKLLDKGLLRNKVVAVELTFQFSTLNMLNLTTTREQQVRFLREKWTKKKKMEPKNKRITTISSPLETQRL